MQTYIAALRGKGVCTLVHLCSRQQVLVIVGSVVSLLLGAYPVWAQDTLTPSEGITLPPMTIEERRPATDLAAESSSHTVLERATLERSEERDLNGVLRGVPGVTLQTIGSRGQLSPLFVRGASSGLGQLGFDGVPLYSTVNNAFNLATLPVDALERVEIVRGASSPRYGSRALGGVIRLTSRDARENAAFLHLEGGSYGTLIDYTYTDSRNLDTHHGLPRRPHHQGRAYVEWQIWALPLTPWLELVYRGSHFDDNQEALRVRDGVYLNAQVNYQLSPHLRLYLRGENLTNDRTPEIFSFGARGTAYFAGMHLVL